MPSSTSTNKSNTMAKKTDTTAPATAPATTPKKGRKAAAPAQTEVTVPVVTATETAPVVTETRTAETILTTLQETLRSLQTEFSGRVRSAVHDAQEAVRALKREARDSKRRRKVDPATLTPEQRKAWEARRANNAFLKVRPLSPELCTFMGLAAGSQRSQTDVTKFISTYVKTHNCFDPKFKRRILPDAKLAKLLKVTDKDEVTYLNLQSFLKTHFIKTA